MLQAASMFDEKPDALLELRFFFMVIYGLLRLAE